MASLKLSVGPYSGKLLAFKDVFIATFMCMGVLLHALSACLVPAEVRRGCVEIELRWLRTIMWVLEIKLQSCAVLLPFHLLTCFV